MSPEKENVDVSSNEKGVSSDEQAYREWYRANYGRTFGDKVAVGLWAFLAVVLGIAAYFLYSSDHTVLMVGCIVGALIMAYLAIRTYATT